jgi:hypothetical protein
MTKKSKEQANKAKVDANLDEALAETFPASDPPAMLERSGEAEARPKRPQRRAARK